jgi:hypothetical protein
MNIPESWIPGGEYTWESQLPPGKYTGESTTNMNNSLNIRKNFQSSLGKSYGTMISYFMKEISV